MELYDDTAINELLKLTADQLVNRIEAFEMAGSGWIVSALKELDTTVWQLNPLRASTSHPLPRWIQNKKAVHNIKNNDMCFKWSILAGLYEPTDPKYQYRVSQYTTCEVCRLFYDFLYMFICRNMLMRLMKDFKKFEKANNISSNVYTIDEITQLKKKKNHTAEEANTHVTTNDERIDNEENRISSHIMYVEGCIPL